MWPVWHAKTVAEGTRAAGAPAGGAGSWSLARSAWAGSHLYNTIVWSGDIGSDWQTLANEVRAGLNFQLTYPYWNTDTGTYHLPVDHGGPPCHPPPTRHLSWC